MKNKLVFTASPLHRFTAFKFLIAMMLAGFYLPLTLHAQTCDPEADFKFSVSGCEAEFLPLYSGPGTVVHDWKFYNGSTPVGLFSSSNAALPIFTFLPVPGVTSKYVVHSVTITLPGGAVIIRTCAKSVPVSCTDIDACYDKSYFYYQVSGCTVSITQGLSPAIPTWDFGDMTPPVTAALPSHVYAASGIYVVIVTLDGKSCSLRIRVDCEESEGCCDPAFEARLDDDCGILRLVLDAKCNNGTHSWSILPDVTGACLSLEGFSSSLPDQTIQVTNINTNIVTKLFIEHRMICNGDEFKETINIPLPNAGIYIGIDGQTTNLTNYNCVLPGSSITGPLKVYVSGVVRIDQPFTFHNMDIQFHKGETGFNIDISHSPLVLEECNLYTNCLCLWRGLQVANRGSLICNAKTTISDALYGIRLLTGSNSSSVILDEVSFTRNFIGIRRTGRPGILSMQRTAFDGTGPLLAICDLTQDVESPRGIGADFDQPIVPVTYRTDKGFAGMYMERGALTLNVLPLDNQNTFAHLAYGIMAYDCNTVIDRNSIFFDIAAVLPGSAIDRHATAGVLFLDRTPLGANTFAFTGNGQSTTAADFDICVQGIVARSEQAAGQSSVGITHTNMTNMRTGIFLDARFGGGEFFGTGNTGPFVGVQHNTIDCSLIPALNQIENGGIVFWDFSPGFSQVDISENDVMVSYPLGSGASTCIAGSGMPLASDPGPGVVEVDMHDNRATLTNLGEVGIGLSGHPNGWIRNNRDNGNGHGIFVNDNAWSGIWLMNSSNNNLVACNEVTLSAGSNAVRGLLNVTQSTNCQFLRNTLTGFDSGAHFQLSCTGTQFRCNDMVNNSFGLQYDDFAVTGDQGNSLVTNGNRWLGTAFAGGADADGSVNTISSLYFVRGGNETPPPIVSPSGWFNPASPTATIDCLSDVCPIPDPGVFALRQRITPEDELIAQGLLVADDAPYAQEQRWKYQYDLWRKLKDYPELAADNAIMQEFLAAFAGSNVEALWNIQVNMRHTIVPSADLLGLVQSNQQIIAQLEIQMAELVAQLAASTDPDQVALLEQQLAEQDSFLTIQIEAQEVVVEAFEAQRTAAITVLLEEVTAIAPENICETNLRSAYQIYLQTFAADRLAESEQLSALETIAMQCPLEGGPGVSAAASIYQGFTGILPTQGNCGDIEGRVQKTRSASALSLYPNPNQGGFVVDIPATLAEQYSLLRILNAWGNLIQSIAIDSERTASFDLSDQPNGLYFVSLLGHSTKTEILSFVIQH